MPFMTDLQQPPPQGHKAFLSLRKVFHVVASSTIPLYYWYHPFAADDATARVQVLVASAVGLLFFLLLDLFRLRDRDFNSKIMKGFSFLIRRSEEKKLTGATYMCFAFLVVIWFFTRPVAVTAMLFLSLGDTAAELSGRYFGRTKVYLRSIEGSAAFFVVAFTVAFVILDDWRVALLGALAGTLVELFSFEIDDNLTVPIGSAVALFLAFLLFQSLPH
jgi:glycerol-3-phosphate acyltransferase PlsY